MNQSIYEYFFQNYEKYLDIFEKDSKSYINYEII